MSTLDKSGSTSYDFSLSELCSNFFVAVIFLFINHLFPIYCKTQYEDIKKCYRWNKVIIPPAIFSLSVHSTINYSLSFYPLPILSNVSKLFSTVLYFGKLRIIFSFNNKKKCTQYSRFFSHLWKLLHEKRNCYLLCTGNWIQWNKRSYRLAMRLHRATRLPLSRSYRPTYVLKVTDTVDLS